MEEEAEEDELSKVANLHLEDEELSEEAKKELEKQLALRR